MTSSDTLCPACGGEVAAGAAYCRHCGERLGNGAPDAPVSDPAAALTYANLLRMRGKWAEAADQCAAVLRLNPANATAQSLLGDIYQDQGRLEEAGGWYRQALEVDPGSGADQAKLARVEEALESRRRKAEWEAVIQARGRSVTAPLERREAIQRVVAIIGAVVCAVILVLATLVTVTQPQAASNEDRTTPLLFRPRRLVADTPREREILRRLSGIGGRPGQLIRVSVDPRSSVVRARIYLDLHGKHDEEPRIAMMREGYRIARSLAELEGTARSFEVEIVGPAESPAPPDQEATDLLLLGALNRTDLVVEWQRVSAAELQTYYSAVAPPFWGVAPRL